MMSPLALPLRGKREAPMVFVQVRILAVEPVRLLSFLSWVQSVASVRIQLDDKELAVVVQLELAVMAVG